MPFLLRTFGTLELSSASGDRLAGAATQRKPLLILALAALTPGGIPRDQLIRALWPGGDPEKARATLKQHLYALRRATGETDLVGGSPRLRIDPALVEVDADRFAALVDDGRLADAHALAAGALLDGVEDDADVGPELRAMILAVRERFASRLALAAAATAEERALPAPVSVAPPTGRALRAAVRRFVQGLVALPADEARARHRVAASSHELFEALLDAELTGVPGREIARALDEAGELWQRSPLVRRMRQLLPGELGDLEVEEWLLDGTVRCVDPIGAAVERVVLDSPLATHPQAIAAWHTVLLGEIAVRMGERPWRVLVLDAGAARAVRNALPFLERSEPSLVLVDRRPEALALARVRLAVLEPRLVLVERDPFVAVDDLATEGPYDLILTGRLYDDLPVRQGAWLTERLLDQLTDDGILVCAGVRAGLGVEVWHRHLADRPVVERDREEMLAVLGPGGMDTEWRLATTPSGETWMAELTRRGAAVT